MATSARSRPRLALAGGFDGGGGGGRRLQMSPQLREAIRLLQLSRRELIEEIRRELAGNPVAPDDALTTE
jgi:hypothetical protein